MEKSTKLQRYFWTLPLVLPTTDWIVLFNCISVRPLCCSALTSISSSTRGLWALMQVNKEKREVSRSLVTLDAASRNCKPDPGDCEAFIRTISDQVTSNHLSHLLHSLWTFQSLLTSLSLFKSPRLLARVERMMGVNHGERVRIIIHREENLVSIGS